METKHRFFVKLDGAPPHFGHEVIAYLNQHYKNHWTDNCGPLPRSINLTPLLIFSWGLMKNTTYRAKVHMREELMYQFMDAAAYVQEGPKIFDRQ